MMNLAIARGLPRTVMPASKPESSESVVNRAVVMASECVEALEHCSVPAPHRPMDALVSPKRQDSRAAVGSWRWTREATSATELFGEQGPRAADVIQGRALGNCYFLSALAGVCRENPDLIKEGIRPAVPAYDEEGRARWDLRLYIKTKEGQIRPVWITVDERFPHRSMDSKSRIGAAAPDTDGDSKSELWVALYEKAFAKLHSYRVSKQDASTHFSGEQLPRFRAGYQLSGRGGIGAEAYFALTGKRMEVHTWRKASEAPGELIRHCESADPSNQQPRVVLLGTRRQEQMEGNFPGLVPAHMYQVLRVVAPPSSDEEPLVVLRNPHGRGEISVPSADRTHGEVRDGKDDGVFELTLSEVNRAFDLVAFATGPSATVDTAARRIEPFDT